MNHKNVMVVSHQRSGTHLTIDAIINNFKVYDKRYISFKEIEISGSKADLIGIGKSDLKKRDKIIKSHMVFDVDLNKYDELVLDFVEEIIQDCLIVYVYRDVKDMLVSLYFHYIQLGLIDENISITDFIKMGNDDIVTEMNRAAYWDFHIEQWSQNENILYLSYEEIVKDYFNTVYKIADFISLIPDGGIKDIRMNNRMSKDDINSIQKHHAITSVNFRNGAIGDYKVYFRNDDIEFISRYAKKSLMRLGYESVS